MPPYLQFIAGSETHSIVRRLLCGERREVAIAVAFWGHGAVDKLGIKSWAARKARILCNATSGACNPDTLSRLRDIFGDKFRTNPLLHAKVYWTPSRVVITSANASTLGLWFAVDGSKGNIEAGISSTDPELIRDVNKWFSQVYAAKNSSRITDDILAQAREKWALKISSQVNAVLDDDPTTGTKKRFKILNVMDKYIDISVPKQGVYSGVWTAPDRGCDIVRVFGGGSEISTLGGRIGRDNPIGERRRRIWF